MSKNVYDCSEDRFMNDTLLHRALTAFAIVVIVLILLAVLDWLSAGLGSAVSAPAPSKFDKELIGLDKDAIRQAYHEQVVRLFAVWMKDETDQPRRALNGINQARRAYIESMTVLEQKEEQK
jgi:hypothetical protein